MATTDTRSASGHITYPGDCVRSIEARIGSGWPMGPNYLGELMWPTDATYDPDTRTTRVGFTLIPPPDVANEMRLVEEKRQKLAQSQARLLTRRPR